MQVTDKKFNSVKHRHGSALVMVIVLTVLLALVAAMFILMSRLDEMSTSSIGSDKQLDNAIETLVDKIEDVLTQDVCPPGSSHRLSSKSFVVNEKWDYPKHKLYPGPDAMLGNYDDMAIYTPLPPALQIPIPFGWDDDAWLASLEPEKVDMSVDMDTIWPAPVSDYGFRHITDLYGTIAVQYDAGYAVYNSTGTDFGADNTDQDGDRVSFRNLRAVILDTLKPVKAGDKADAEGDGVADSRWFIIPNITTPKGQPIYAAVRIIDNGGMINVNTAYRNPDSLASVPGEWSGAQLSHVNIEGSFISGTDVTDSLDASHLQAMRYGTILIASTPGATDFYDYINDIEYEANAARRFTDPKVILPGQMYMPFGIGDELELRNRFFLTTSYDKPGTVTRLGETLPATFNPQADPGRGLPFGSRPTDDIDDWYAKVGPDVMGESNRRHYSTAYNNENSFGKIYDDLKAAAQVPQVFYPDPYTVYPASMNTISLSEERRVGITLPLDIQNGSAGPGAVDSYVNRLAMAIYRGLPEENPPAFTPYKDRFGTAQGNTPFYTREQLAWQMALNMVDCQDKDNSGTETITKKEILNGTETTTYYGTESLDDLKKSTICISKIGYLRRTSASLPGRYFAIELFNPNDDFYSDPKDLTGYKVVFTDKNGNYQSEFTIDSGTIDHSAPKDPVTGDPLEGDNDTIVFACNQTNPGMLQNSIASVLQAAVPARLQKTLNPATSLPVTFEFKKDWKIILYDATGTPVDCANVPSDVNTNKPNVLDVRLRRTVLPGTHFLLPRTSAADPWEVANPAAFGTKLTSPLDPSPDANVENDLQGPELFPVFGSAVRELEHVGVQLWGTNKPLSNIGEIENVLAVGTRYIVDDGGTPADKTDDEHECTTFIQYIAESLIAQLDSDPAALPGDTIDQEAGIEMKSFGRIPLKDPIYAGLLDSLTFFDGARDGVDLHNAAEGAVVSNPVGSTAGAALDTLTDGLFLPKDTPWDSAVAGNETVNWTNHLTTIVINLGSVQTIWGLIVQADHNDEYIIEWWDGGTWWPLWTVENNDPAGALAGGMQTRPDAYDEGLWHLLDGMVNAQYLQIRTTSTVVGSYAVSEVQIGVKASAYDPYLYGDNIAGRVNINTAPWYVINQLPWVEDLTDPEHGSLAQAIVAFRDKAATLTGPDYSGLLGRSNITGISGINEDAGFTAIAELMQVINKDSDPVAAPLLVDHDIRKNIFDDNPAGPSNGDYTVDTTINDFEERNLIFHRISNLVTVRSDVFTAYILVRIGTDGPQRRMIAIFDRSQVNSPTDKPKLVAIQPVPDPR